MGLFQKDANRLKNEDNLPQYVDSLLDAADLDSTQETEITGNPLDYGIDQAIELLQKLPQENASLVVTVVQETLRSASIDVSLVVEDAQNKVLKMQEKVSALKSEIAVLKTQIAQKEAEIVQTDSVLKETRRVQELLQQVPESAGASVVKLNTAKTANRANP